MTTEIQQVIVTKIQQMILQAAKMLTKIQQVTQQLATQ